MRSSNATQILSCVIWKQFASLTKAFHGTAWTQVFRSHLVMSTLVAVPKLLILCSRTCCRDVGPNGTDDKHSLEKHLCHVASTTSTLVVFPCPFVQVSLRRCHLEMTDWIVVPGAWVGNPRNADDCTPVAFWGLGFGKVKALLRKPRHQHLLVGDPLNSVG